jgi:hypothetical protein
MLEVDIHHAIPSHASGVSFCNRERAAGCYAAVAAEMLATAQQVGLTQIHCGHELKRTYCSSVLGEGAAAAGEFTHPVSTVAS